MGRIPQQSESKENEEKGGGGGSNISCNAVCTKTNLLALCDESKRVKSVSFFFHIYSYVYISGHHVETARGRAFEFKDTWAESYQSHLYSRFKVTIWGSGGKLCAKFWDQGDGGAFERKLFQGAANCWQKWWCLPLQHWGRERGPASVGWDLNMC